MVRDGDGRAGIWFFSLDAARLSAVSVARATYRLPYFWSAMRVAERDGQDGLHLAGWPAAGPAICCQPGCGSASTAGFGADELGERDHFLTARWVLFSSSGTWHRLARASHEPWPLYRARAQVVDDQLIAAAGLPQPDAEPLVHYSPGVDVRIGRPEKQW